MRAVEIKLPTELAEELGLESEKELKNHTRLLLAIDLYMGGKIPPQSYRISWSTL